MPTIDPLNLDYMDSYAVQVFTDAIFERIGQMIVDEISSNVASNDNEHIPSTLAVYNYLTNIASNLTSNIISNISQYTLPVASSTTLGGIKVGNNLSIDSDGKLNANINAIPSGQKLDDEKIYKIKTNLNGQIISATEATAADIQNILSLSLSKPNNNTISLNVNGSSVSSITDNASTGSSIDTNTTYTLSKSGNKIILTGSDGSSSSVTDNDTTSSTTVTQKTTSGTQIATINGTAIYNGVASSSNSGKGFISVRTGSVSSGASDTISITAPTGATSYVFFVVGDSVVSGLTSTGSCTSGQSLSFSVRGNTGFRNYVCLFFG